MVGLIYKEFAIQRRSLTILGVSCGLFILALFFPLFGDYVTTLSSNMGADRSVLLMIWEFVIYVLLFLIVGMYQPTIFEADESKKWAGFVSSTPLTGKGQIAAKYYFVLLLSVMIHALCWCFNYIYAAVYQLDFSLVDILVILFYIQLLLRAFELPFVVRFGSKNGDTYKGFLFLILVMVVVIYLLFGDLSAFGSINTLIDELFKALTMDTTSMGYLVLPPLLPIISVVCFYASYHISCKLYLKGVETYDK